MGADETTDQRPDGDQRHRAPGDAVEADDDVCRRGHRVDHEGEQVLGCVHPLHGLGQQHPHHADQQDALGGGEIAPVDADQERGDDQGDEPAAGDGVVVAAGRFGPSPDGRLQSRLHHDQHQGDHQQHRDDLLERRLRQVQQQPGPHQRTQERGRDLPLEPRALALQLPPVAEGAGGAAGHQADRVGHGGHHRRVTERDQRREGDQRAGTDDRIDRARTDPGQEDGDDLDGAHPGTLRARSYPAEATWAAPAGHPGPGVSSGERPPPCRRR